MDRLDHCNDRVDKGRVFEDLGQTSLYFLTEDDDMKFVAFFGGRLI